MRKKRFLMALVALVLVASMLCGSAMAAMSAKVFSTSMPVYRSTSTRYKLGSLPQGTSFKVKKIADSKWARISYKGKTGYAELKNIVFDKHIKAVSTKKTRIRFLTRSSYKKSTYYTGTLAKGVTLYVAGMNGSYYLFYDKSGSTMGYVSKSAVRRAK